MGCRLWGRTESDTTEATWQQQQLEYKCQPLHQIFSYFSLLLWASLVAQMVKNLPAMWETQGPSSGQEDPDCPL